MFFAIDNIAKDLNHRAAAISPANLPFYAD